MDAQAGIQVGDIVGSYGIAIGAGAKSKVYVFLGPAYPRPNYRSSVADLLSYYTRIFVGRAQVREELSTWASGSTPGYFLMTATAGFGKSALMASLILRREAGEWPAPAPDLLYFFVRQEGRRNTPEEFLQAVNGQLLELLDVPGGVPPDLSLLRDQFSQLWDAAVKRAKAEKRPLLLLVDGLDEMSRKEPNIAAVLPKDLPDHVHVVVTSRPYPDPQANLDMAHPLREAALLRLGPLSEPDVVTLLVEHGASPAIVALAGRVWAVTQQGEPLLARFVSQEVALEGEPALQRLEAQPPKGVKDYFRLQLKQLADSANDDLARRILGLLVVALGRISPEEIHMVLGDPLWKVSDAIDLIHRFLIGEERLELMHQTFRDVLLEENRFSRQEQAKLREQLLAFCASWSQDRSWYALRHYAEQLGEAARMSNQPERHSHTQSLVELVVDPGFQQAHLEIVQDLPRLRQELLLALDLAAVNHPDPGSATLAPLVGAARGLTTFSARHLHPSRLLDLVGTGKLEEAVSQLALFAVEPEWRHAATLMLAWAAGEKAPATARAVAMKTMQTADTQLTHLLAQRVLSDLDHEPYILSDYLLPNAPTWEQVQSILGRFGNSALFDSGLIMGITNLEMTRFEEIEGSLPIDEYLRDFDMGAYQPVFAAAVDGLHLVAFAVDEQDQGRQAFERYINLHAANSYIHYRNVSLRFLLDAALRHPDSEWVREMVQQIVMGALAGSEVAFQDALPIALTALREQAGEPAIAGWLAARSQAALDAAAELSSAQEHNDPFGRYRRTLGALAEVNACLGQGNLADLLIDNAIEVPRGYAGYQTTACLALAESIRVAAPATNRHEKALALTKEAAHNIQETLFCVRSTARLKAMQERWWNDAEPFDVERVVQQLVERRTLSDWAALHRIGEDYEKRGEGPNNLRLPDEVYAARTLRQLSELYQRLLSEFQRLNAASGWEADDELPIGTLVNVPDPEFAPTLAARLAAEALVAPKLDGQTRLSLIQRLVPIAAENPTALDAVLARLLLAARPIDLPSLAAIADILGEAAVPEGGWAERGRADIARQRDYPG